MSTVLSTFTCGACGVETEGVPFGPVGVTICFTCWFGKLEGKLLVRPGEEFDLPRTFYCPECGAGLQAGVMEWDTDTLEPTDVGVSVSCRFEMGQSHHQPPGRWARVERAAEAWVIENARVLP